MLMNDEIAGREWTLVVLEEMLWASFLKKNRNIYVGSFQRHFAVGQK